jgi:hypothetical protein
MVPLRKCDNWAAHNAVVYRARAVPPETPGLQECLRLNRNRKFPLTRRERTLHLSRQERSEAIASG